LYVRRTADQVAALRETSRIQATTRIATGGMIEKYMTKQSLSESYVEPLGQSVRSK
jgi:hypothetical protein